MSESTAGRGATPAEAPELRLAVLGSFHGEAEARAEPLAVDAERLDEALAAVAPRLALELPDPSSGATRRVELRFERMRDFAPAGLAEQVPALAELVELRALVDALERGELGREAFRERAAGRLASSEIEEALSEGSARGRGAEELSRADARAERAESSSVDAILDLVETGSEPETARDDTARRLVDELTPRPARRGAAERGGAGALRRRVDARLSAGLGTLLAEPAFRALEARWRGLQWLVRRVDFREPVRLELVSVEAEALPEALAALGERGGADLALAASELDASARDLARAEALAEAAEGAQTPVAVALAPAFFGAEGWRELARGRSPGARLEEPAYADWRSFRGREGSRWIALLANRMALRAPYGEDGASARGLPCEESGSGLVGSPVWALGSVVARSFARAGSAVHLTGPRHGLVPDLDLLRASPGEAPGPVEGPLSEDRCEDLERAGIAPLRRYRGDAALFAALPTYHRPERYPDAEATADAAQQATLGYQLFAARVARFLGRALPGIAAVAEDDALAAELRHTVCRFLSTAERPLPADHVGVAVRPHPEDEGWRDVSLRVQPETTLRGRPLDLLLRFPLPR